MKRISKLIAIVLAVVMVMTMLPIMSYADEAETEAAVVETELPDEPAAAEEVTAETPAAEPAAEQLAAEEAAAEQPAAEAPAAEVKAEEPAAPEAQEIAPVTEQKEEPMVAAPIEAADDEAAVAAGAYWAYTTVGGATTYYADMIGESGAYTQGLANDDTATSETAGVLKLLQDWTIDNSTNVMSTTYAVLYNPTKAINIDLNGHTITNSRTSSSTYLVYLTSPSYNDWYVHIFSSRDGGAYVNTTTGTRGFVGLGAGSVDVKYSAYVDFENFTATTGKGSLLSSNVVNLTLNITDCDFTAVGGTPLMIQMSTKAVVTTQASAIMTFENVGLHGNYSLYLINGQSTSNRSADYTYSLTLIGTNTFDYATGDTAASYHGMRVRLYDPDGVRSYYDWTDFCTVPEGSTIEISEPVTVGTNNTITATVTPGIDIAWDTDGDGTVDEVVAYARNAHPTHADGEKPYNASTATVYEFTGWSDGQTTYAPGEELPLPVEGTTYTAQFAANVITEFHKLTFVDEDGSVLYENKRQPILLPVSYPNEFPTKETDDYGVYEFFGWTDGETIYAADTQLPAVTADTTYTAVYENLGAPVAKYTSVAGEITYFPDFFSAYSASASDPGASPTKGGEITLLKDIKLSEDGGSPLTTIDDKTSESFYMVIWKNQTNALNLNFAGHTIVNDVNKHFITVFSTVSKGANPNATIHLYSKAADGTTLEGGGYIYPSTNTAGRQFIKYCENSASTVLTSSVIMAPKATVEDLYIESQCASSVISSFFISGYVKLYRCTIVNYENTSNSVASMQLSSNTSSIASNKVDTNVTFEDCEIVSGGLVLYYTNSYYSTSDRHDNYAPTMTISGTTTLYYPTSSSNADYWNLVTTDNVYPGETKKSILDTPIANTGDDDSLVMISSEETDQTYTYTPYGGDETTIDGLTKLVLIPACAIKWDTDGDGVVDDVTGYLPTEHPTHADGERGFNAATKTFYTFKGWKCGSKTYLAGEELPLAETSVTYTAVFTETKDNEAVAAWTAADGEITVCRDMAEIADFVADANANGAIVFDLLTDYTLTADLTIDGISYFDAHNHSISGDFGIFVNSDTLIVSAKIDLNAETAVTVSSASFEMTDSTVKATGLGFDFSGANGNYQLTEVDVFANSAKEDGVPAIYGADGTTLRIDGCVIASNADAPTLISDGTMFLDKTEAYVLASYYEENEGWYAGTGSVNSNLLSVSRGTFRVPTVNWQNFKRIAADSPVAMIGTTGYTSLYWAVKSAVKGNTITLLQDVDRESELQAWIEDATHTIGNSNGVPNNYTMYVINKDLTIDLNGYTLQGPGPYTYTTGDSTYTLLGRCFSVSGSKRVFTIKNGKLDFTAQTATGSYGIICGSNNQTLNMINVDMDAKYRGVWSSTSYNGNTFNFYGGTYYHTTTASNYCVQLSTAAATNSNRVNIYNGARFIKNAATGSIYIGQYDSLYIEDGEFWSGNTETGYRVGGETTQVILPEGVEPEYIGKDTYEGTQYSIVRYQKVASPFEAELDGVTYDSLTDAITAAEEGDTVTLTRNVTAQQPMLIPANVKVDTNGFTLTLPAGSEVGGQVLNEARTFDSSISLKKVSLSLTDPVKLNLKFSKPELTVEIDSGAGAVQAAGYTLKNNLYSYSFDIDKADYATEFAASATDGTAYGFPVTVSVLRYAQNAAASGNTKLAAATAALLYYGNPDADYEGIEKVTTLAAYDEAVGDTYLQMNGNDFNVIYEGATGDFTVSYIDVYGAPQQFTVTGEQAFVIPAANVMKTITLSKEGAASETTTMMEALKKGGYLYAAIYGYYAAQYFGG